MSTTDHHPAPHRLRSEDEVRGVIGSPSDLVLEKELDRLDAHCAAFIALSPMVIVATADAEGHCDASPRGDPPGFVRVLDDATLLIPDRKGNRRIDTMVNLTANPQVGLLFLIPGVNETLRANGSAEITEDPDLLVHCAVRGKAPKLGVIVTVEEVFFHCARSFLRSGLWDHDSWVDRSALPTLGQILSDQVHSRELNPDTLDASLEEANRNLY